MLKRKERNHTLHSTVLWFHLSAFFNFIQTIFSPYIAVYPKILISSSKLNIFLRTPRHIRDNIHFPVR